MHSGFKTGRTVGKPIQPSDFDNLHSMYRDPKLMTLMGGRALSEDESRDRLNAMLEHWDTHRFGICMVHDRADDRFLGRAGFRMSEIDGQMERELWCGFMPDCWRKGIATEVAFELVNLAFEELNFEDLVAVSLSENKGSRRLIEKTGFSYEKDVTYAGLEQAFYRQKNPDR
ncbi:MAG: N-acetyltransferase [Alphaproteobacteria bacterium]|nr:MAG: N-acetyltransferase [Alphaproteobacteria bacterium]